MKPKWFLRSKTIVAAIIALIPIVCEAFGMTWSKEQIALLDATIGQIMTAVGGVAVLIDRLFFPSKRDLKPFPQLRRRG